MLGSGLVMPCHAAVVIFLVEKHLHHARATWPLMVEFFLNIKPKQWHIFRQIFPFQNERKKHKVLFSADTYWRCLENKKKKKSKTCGCLQNVLLGSHRTKMFHLFKFRVLNIYQTDFFLHPWPWGALNGHPLILTGSAFANLPSICLSIICCH